MNGEELNDCHCNIHVFYRKMHMRLWYKDEIALHFFGMQA